MSNQWIMGLSRLQPGDQIEVWDQQHRRHVGTVSQVAAHLQVLWIVETSTGLPKLISFGDFRLRRVPAIRAA